MDHADNALADFLRARRAAVQPADVGLVEVGYRRVPGLRRQEVAMLAGVSVEYLTRLEQGRDRHPSAQILDALAAPLGLDSAAVDYLRRLAEPRPRRRRRRRPETVRPGVLSMLDSLQTQPALVIGRYRDVLAANPLAQALCPGFAPGRNILRYVFLEPSARDVYANWDDVAVEAARTLRVAIGTDTDDAAFTDLVGELSIKSEAFQRLWSRHEVREKTIGVKTFIHPLIGKLSLQYESLTINGSDGQTLSVYHARPDTPDARALVLLAATLTPLDTREATTDRTSTGGRGGLARSEPPSNTPRR